MASTGSTRRPYRVAVEGCGHGTLHSIYASIALTLDRNGWDTCDLLIIGGDFQAVRNRADLLTMAVPAKYRVLGDFHEYYSGQRKAPYLTLVVGGNHEASGHFHELHYGGWIAPNIYYLGAANVVRFGELRIAALSGIWKGHDFRKPHFERPPFTEDEVRSVYHVRESDTRKLLQLRNPVDIGLSHDWPNGVEWQGDWRWLFQVKKHLRPDAESKRLGSIAAKLVLEWLRPDWWFSAHLHVKYAAVLHHSSEKPNAHQKINNNLATKQEAITEPLKNEEEIDLDDDLEDEPQKSQAEAHPPQNNETVDSDTHSSAVPADIRAELPAAFQPKSEQAPPEPDPPNNITNAKTKFLALDKCLQGRDFLQMIEILPGDEHPDTLQNFYTDGQPCFSYDPEWLAVTRAFALTHPEFLAKHASTRVGKDKGRAAYAKLIEEASAFVNTNIVNKNLIQIPDNFSKTAPTETDLNGNNELARYVKEYNNPQTQAYCALLDIPNHVWSGDEEVERRATEKSGVVKANGDSDNSCTHSRGRGRGWGRGRGRGRGNARGRGRGWGRGNRWSLEGVLAAHSAHE